MMAGLVILGAGGHARSVADVALAIGIAELIFVDDNARPDETIAGFPVVKAEPTDLPPTWSYLPAIGDNSRRQELCERVEARLGRLATLISPRASIGFGSEIGPGSFVGHHCHVGPLARTGRGTILNTSAIVEHDCVIGDYAHIAVNATLAGRVRLGTRVLIGAGAVVIPGCVVADDTIVGAGAVVTRAIEKSGTYVGAPAQRVGSRGK